MNKFLLGCDPELFLADAAGSLRSSIGLIGGTKDQPRPLPLGPGYGVQEDNVAVEFNVPPSENDVEFSAKIGNTIAFLSDQVEALYGLKFINVSAASFPEQEVQSDAAKMFGCEPDYNAWTLEENPKPKAADPNLRSCGGHVHVGMKLSGKDKIKLVKLMDLFLSVPAVVLDNGFLRKELYGKRGAFRDKPYGLEYRPLSNFWVFEDRLRIWVWKATEAAVDALQQGFDVDALDSVILDAVDHNNRDLAQQLIHKYNLVMP